MGMENNSLLDQKIRSNTIPELGEHGRDELLLVRVLPREHALG